MKIPQWAFDKIMTARERRSLNLDLNGLGEEQLTELPDILFELEHLTWLDLSNNQIAELPPSIAVLQNLSMLDISNNRLTSLPKSLEALQNITWLFLDNNQIENFPAPITELRNLQWLSLKNNRLGKIPTSIAKLKSLKELNLGSNRLDSLPDMLSTLQNLQMLNLDSNNFSTISNSITTLRKLVTLNVNNNPLVTPPPEIAYKGIKAIRNYFRQLNSGQDYLYEAKLLILGEGGAGKTTLAKKIEDPNYKLKDEKSTEGIDIANWSFPIENDRLFRVNIWDFGGQEIYHATHQFFLTKRSVYALVADTRKEDTDFYYWMNVVELLSDNSPLIIIKNEKQDRHREISERQLRGQFENLKEILATNLETNRGLDKVVGMIKHYAKNLPHIGSALPKTWVRVREKLEKDERNHVTLEEYLNVCKENGFDETKDSLQLSGYLHDIGVFLHFQDDPLLKKTVILKPKWGTDAVYTVLDDKDVIRNLGRFTRDDLAKIWNSPEYNNMQDELLQLMIKFKLCYEIPNKEGTYIAPQLLTENQPRYPWPLEDNLFLRYKFEFMPKGILIQFIVAMNQYIATVSSQSIVWKSGVVIAKDRTAAEVIEYYDKREIQVRVSGAHKKELLAILMHQLDEIHSSFGRLKYDKLIPCNCANCKDVQEPHFYLFEQLQNFLERQIDEIQCGRTGRMVSVHGLIDNVIGLKSEKDVEKIMLKQTAQGSINIGDNFSGTIIVGSAIRDSLNKIDSANISLVLRDALKGLVREVEVIKKDLSIEQVEEVSDDLAKLIDEATKKSPNKKWYSVSIDGLTKAAENLGKVGEPVVKLAGKVLALLAGA